MAKQLNCKTCHICGKANFGAKRINNVIIRECKDCKALFDTIKYIPFVLPDPIIKIVQPAKFALSSKAQLHISGILKKLMEKGCKVEDLQLRISPESELAGESSVMTDCGMLAIKINEYAKKGTAYLQSHPKHDWFEWVSRTTKEPQKGGNHAATQRDNSR